MKVKLADGKTRDALPGDKIQFRDGSVVEVQKTGQFRNAQKKGVGKKRRKRPAKQKRQISVAA